MEAFQDVKAENYTFWFLPRSEKESFGFLSRLDSDFFKSRRLGWDRFCDGSPFRPNAAMGGGSFREETLVCHG